ncbi:hypothetical protein [Nostoc sp.]|uniref:hypothetical protein n=1 Tax=Nostoc sp. TaxID=1180 RepID=UPI002FF57B1B
MSNDAIIQSELLDDKANKEQNLRKILSLQELSLLNDRSNSKGLVKLIFHLIVMGCSSYLWATNFGNWSVAIPALII